MGDHGLHDHRVMAWDLEARFRPQPCGQPMSPSCVSSSPLRAVMRRRSPRRSPRSGTSISEEITGSVTGDEALAGIQAQLAIDDAMIARLDGERIAADDRAGDDPERRPAPSERTGTRPLHPPRLLLPPMGDRCPRSSRAPLARPECEDLGGRGGSRPYSGEDGWPVEVVDVERRERVVRLVGHSRYLRVERSAPTDVARRLDRWAGSSGLGSACRRATCDLA